MTEERSPGSQIIELNEELLQHIEVGSSKIMKLSIITIGVSSLLAIGFFSQLIVAPLLLGMTTVTVNLLDPLLAAFEAVLLALTVLWLYVALRDYRFTSRLSKSIKEIRAKEAEFEKRITG